MKDQHYKLFEKLNNKDCFLNDIVPEIYKYHSSFYRTLKDLSFLIKVDTDIYTKRNFYSLTKDGKTLFRIEKTRRNLNGEL